MKKFFTIFKAEYAQVVKKKSFVFGLILTPLLMIAISILPVLLTKKGVSKPVTYSIVDIDGRGIGQALAKSMDRYKLDSDSTKNAYDLQELYELPANDYAGLDSMRSYLDSLVLQKQIRQYIMIYPGVENNDSIIAVSKSIGIRSSSRFNSRISEILSGMRLEKSNINLPVDSVLAMTRRIEMLAQSPGGKERDFLVIYLGTLTFVMIIFVSVISFGQVLMRSVVEEKSSRIMEVLVSSVSPFQLMMGKIFGLGAANLTQFGIWLVLGALFFVFHGAMNMDIPASVAQILFNPILIVFFFCFLFLAYLIYSTIFALIGAVCTTDKEAQNFVFPIVMSLMLPVMTLMYIIQEPDAAFSTVLSFIPIFTPTMMMARLNISSPEVFSLGNPIIMDACLGVIIAALFAVFLIWMTGRIFRMGILMYGKRATLNEVLTWIRHK